MNLKKNLKDLKYIIIPARPSKVPFLEEIQNASFSYWKSFWKDVFTSNGCPDDLDCDVFFRQDMICLLADGAEIAGMHLYTVFGLNNQSCLNHSYFTDSFTADYIEKVKSRGAQFAMSMEYLTVNPDWRKKNVGLSLGTLFVGLANQVMNALSCDVSIAPSRSDVGVTKMVCDWGGEVVVGNLDIHNTPCDLIAIYRDRRKSHEENDYNHWVNHFWSGRMDYSGLTIGVPVTERNLENVA